MHENMSTSMTVLNLDENQIQSLPVNALDPLRTLTHLHVTGNNITSLEAALASQNSTLKHLDVSHNAISQTHAQFFAHLFNMEVIVLNHNALQVLPDFGDAASVLRDVRVAHNNIDALNTSHLLQFDAIVALQVTNNPFDCFPSLSGTPLVLTLEQLRVNGLNLGDSCPDRPLAELAVLSYLEAINSGLETIPDMSAKGTAGRSAAESESPCKHHSS